MTQDVIIIGSGLGGLTCGAALASVGMRVSVLEKHHTIGGYLQGFTRKSWHWNVGTHYVGDLGASGTFSRLLDALTDHRIVMHPLADSYERILADGYRHDVVANRDDVYLRQLQQEFPSEGLQLAAFFKLLRKMRKRLGLLFAPKLLTGPNKYLAHALSRTLFFRYWNKTLEEVLDSYFSDPRLKLLLAVHCDKTLLHPSEASFLSWAVIQSSYQDGASYPAGSGEAISNALRDTIISRGGTVRTREGVRQILLNGKRVAGVLLDNGERFECDKVVSNIGIIETAEQLMPDGCSSPRQRAVMERYKPSGAYMTLHIGFEGDLTPYGIQKINYRILGDTPYDFTTNPLEKDWHPDNVLVTFPSIRDTAHTDELHHTAEMIVPVQYRHFEKWAAAKVDKRGEDYNHHKERITARLLNLMNNIFPGIVRTVAFTNLSTPVSFSHYTGHKSGAAYGLSSKRGRITDLDLHPVSDIKGLYYTGADALSQGITGVFMSGIFTAVAISGKFSIFRLKPTDRT